MLYLAPFASNSSLVILHNCLQICEYSDSKQAIKYLLEHCSSLVRIDYSTEKTHTEEFSSRDIKRAAQFFDEAAKVRIAADNQRKQQQLQYKCPGLFANIIRIISDVEKDKALADALKILPYIKSQTTTKNTEITIATNYNKSEDDEYTLPLLVAPAAVAVVTAGTVDEINYVSELIEFIHYVNGTGSLRGTLVLLKLLFTILEHPDIQITFRKFLSTEYSFEKPLVNVGFENIENKDLNSKDENNSKRSSTVTPGLLKDIERSNLIGKNDIINIIELMNEQDRLLNFDCYPRILLESGSPEKLRALEVQGSVTGYIGGVFVKPNTGHSYFEVTLKGCNVGALGLRVGWGLCGVSTLQTNTATVPNTKKTTNTNETIKSSKNLNISNAGASKRRNSYENENISCDLPGDSERSWTFDGSCGGHLYHNAKKLMEIRNEETLKSKTVPDDTSVKISINDDKIISVMKSAADSENDNIASVNNVLIEETKGRLLEENNQSRITSSDLSPTGPPPPSFSPSPSPSLSLSPTAVIATVDVNEKSNIVSSSISASSSSPSPFPLSPLLPSLPSIAATDEYDTMNATLTSLDKVIADLDFSDVFNTIKSTDSIPTTDSIITATNATIATAVNATINAAVNASIDAAVAAATNASTASNVIGNYDSNGRLKGTEEKATENVHNSADTESTDMKTENNRIETEPLSQTIEKFSLKSTKSPEALSTEFPELADFLEIADLPGFVDYVKSLVAGDVDPNSTLSSSKGPETVNPFGGCNSGISSESGPESGSQRDKHSLDYAKIFIKMLKVGISINTISTTDTRNSIFEFLSQKNVSDEDVSNFIIMHKYLDEQTKSDRKEEVKEVETKKITLEEINNKIVPKAIMKKNVNLQMAQESSFNSGGTFIGSMINDNNDDDNNNDDDDSDNFQPFPPYPKNENELLSSSSISISNNHIDSEVVWCTDTVLGCLLNTHSGVISFYINGNRVGTQNISMGVLTENVRPVFSCTSLSGLEFNIGQTNFLYEPILTVSCEKLNPIVSLANLFETYSIPSEENGKVEKEVLTEREEVKELNEERKDDEEESHKGEEKETEIVTSMEIVRCDDLSKSDTNDKPDKIDQGVEVEVEVEVDVIKNERLPLSTTGQNILHPLLFSSKSPFFRLGSPSSSSSSSTSSTSSSTISSTTSPFLTDINIMSSNKNNIDNDMKIDYRRKKNLENFDLISKFNQLNDIECMVTSNSNHSSNNNNGANNNDDNNNNIKNDHNNDQNIKNLRGYNNIILIKKPEISVPLNDRKGLTIESSIRILPNDFYSNSSKSVKSDILSNLRVVTSFGLNIEKKIVECLICINEERGISFIIRSNTSSTDMNNDCTYKSSSNIIFPFIWNNLTVIIHNNNNNDISKNKLSERNKNIQIFLNELQVGNFSCEILNNLLGSPGCELGDVALGGPLTVVEKKDNYHNDDFKSLTYQKIESGNVIGNKDDEGREKGTEKEIEMEAEEEKFDNGNREEKEDFEINPKNRNENLNQTRNENEKENEEQDDLNDVKYLPTSTSTSSASTEYRIKTDPGSVDSCFIGDICEFRFWSTPRSTDLISNSIGRSKISGTETDLLICLAFQEGCGLEILDLAVRNGSVRSKDSIRVIQISEKFSFEEHSLSDCPGSLWGFQMTDKTFLAAMNIKSMNCDLISVKLNNSGLPPGSKRSVERNVLQSKSEKEFTSGCTSSISLVLNSIFIKLMTSAENYLQADSGDLKVWCYSINFVLVSFVMLCYGLFYSVLSCCILLYFVSFHFFSYFIFFISFRLFCFILFYFILICFTLFYLLSFLSLRFILF